jgi:hypothetical protein
LRGVVGGVALGVGIRGDGLRLFSRGEDETVGNGLFGTCVGVVPLPPLLSASLAVFEFPVEEVMLIFILLASESLPLLRFRFSSRSF